MGTREKVENQRNEVISVSVNITEKEKDPFQRTPQKRTPAAGIYPIARLWGISDKGAGWIAGDDRKSYGEGEAVSEWKKKKDKKYDGMRQ